MAKRDKQGRQYAKLSELKRGDIVTVDGDFSCMPPWSQHVVQGERKEGLFITCKSGPHYLDEQLQPDGYLMGIYPGKVMVS